MHYHSLSWALWKQQSHPLLLLIRYIFKHDQYYIYIIFYFGYINFFLIFYFCKFEFFLLHLRPKLIFEFYEILKLKIFLLILFKTEYSWIKNGGGDGSSVSPRPFLWRALSLLECLGLRTDALSLSSLLRVPHRFLPLSFSVFFTSLCSESLRYASVSPPRAPAWESVAPMVHWFRCGARCWLEAPVSPPPLTLSLCASSWEPFASRVPCVPFGTGVLSLSRNCWVIPPVRCISCAGCRFCYWYVFF